MNRRGFLTSLITVPAAAWLSPTVLATSTPPFVDWKLIPSEIVLDDGRGIYGLQALIDATPRLMTIGYHDRTAHKFWKDSKVQ